MFRTLIALTLACIFFAPKSGFSSALEEVTILGVGETKSEAIKDAQRQALIQVVGRYVVSRDRLKNRKELSENIYSYSNGFISDFEILNTSNANGLVEVKARAEVSRTKLFKIFEGLNIDKISVDQSAANLAGSSADQSRDFTSLMEDQFFAALDERNIYDIDIESIEIVDIFPKNHKIYLGNSKSAIKIDPGDHFFDQSCRMNADCNNHLMKGLMTGISVNVTVQLSTDYIGRMKQLFKNVSESTDHINYRCDFQCKSGVVDLTSRASEITGVSIFEDGKGTHYKFSQKNELIFDNLVAKRRSVSSFIDVNITDFSTNSIAYLTFISTGNQSMFQLATPSSLNIYGESGVLSYAPTYQPVTTREYSRYFLEYHHMAFFPGINSRNFSVINGEAFKFTLPLMVTEEVASKLNEIEVEIRWD